jgi:hypothetical protein
MGCDAEGTCIRAGDARHGGAAVRPDAIIFVTEFCAIS